MDQRVSRRKMLTALASAGAAVVAGAALNGGAAGLVRADGAGVTGAVYGGGGTLLADDSIIVTTIAELKAMTDPGADAVYFVRDEEREGYFVFDPADVSTPDNGGTVLVSSSGDRFFRIVENGILNVKWFGAKGDHVPGGALGTDDTAAIAAAAGALQVGQTLFFPRGYYRTTSTIAIGHTVSLDSDEAVLVADHNGVCLQLMPATRSNFGDGEYVRLRLNVSFLKRVPDYAQASVALRIVNSYYGCFTVGRIKGFTTGILLTADTVNGQAKGSAYNTFYLGRIENCQTGIELRSTATGWVTENSFYGGSFGGQAAAGATHIFVNGNNIGYNNNNKFFNQSLEGFHETGIRVTGAANNCFYETRLEMPHAVWIADFGTNTQSNKLISSGVGGKPDKISDVGRYNRMSSASLPAKYVEYFDGVYFTFVKPGTTMTPINGFPQIPVGPKPTKYVSSTSATIELDLSVATYHIISVNTDVTSIQFSNLPTLFRGCEVTVQLIQNASSGYSIGGFPAEWKFGSRSSAPAKRAFGTDIYTLLYDGSRFVVMQQYSS
ncbi:hypothetical protein [Paenibacillus flagellatus]|uniref:Pectate lyase superfamily protein domain-containing protein n=1 Tax=Paenibacillus flagellatus TaxID=2211139 RepID=A0A2V5KW91_9BACL|nr:hypothetical protein [Paenibacillus flagellatus]PYI56547.1 hypothetical protein DLM86_06145 [Paenibacillus flagellatus]